VHPSSGKFLLDGLPDHPRSSRGQAPRLGDAGLTLQRLEELSARNEDNAPAPGLVVVAAKP
jgi:hypothetical protein